MRLVHVSAVLSALALLWPSPSLANGRYPSADQLLLDPADSTHLVLRATFGLLSSHDAGLTWQWVCEDAIGYAGDRDPALAIFQNGSVAAGYGRDLRVSGDDGCSWPSPYSNATTETFIDATADPSDSTNAFFLSRSLSTSRLARVFIANQAATSLTALEGSLGDDIAPLTLEVAPSMPARMYVTAVDANLASTLLRSDDSGKNWQRSAIHPDDTLPAYIAAVDPNNPDRLYLRLDGDSSDVLLISDDGGMSFQEAYSLDADMLGFAISPDGSKIALGGPSAGLFTADSKKLEFVMSPAPIANLSCLKWTDSALMACARESTDGFTLGSSTDDGQTFTPLFHVADLTPLTCKASTDVNSHCPAVWPGIAQSVGIDAGASAGSAAGPAPAGGCGCAVPRSSVWRLGQIATLALCCGVALRRLRGARWRA